MPILRKKDNKKNKIKDKIKDKIKNKIKDKIDKNNKDKNKELWFTLGLFGVVILCGLFTAIRYQSILPQMRMPLICLFSLAGVVLLLGVLTKILRSKMVTVLAMISKVLNGALLLITPAIILFIAESIAGKPALLSVKYAILNVLLLYTVFIIIFVLCNNLRLAAILFSVIIVGIYTTQFYVVLFRGTVFVPADILSLNTVATVAGDFDFLKVEPVLFYYVMAILWLISISQGTFRIKQKKNRLILDTVLVTVVSLSYLLYAIVGFQYYKVTIGIWDTVACYQKYGYFASTITNVKDSRLAKPEGYSKRYAKEILKEAAQTYDEIYGTTVINKGVMPENVIVIMNESWTDFTEYKNFTSDQDPYAFYHSLSENAIKGNLYSSVYGGRTAQTEFELLTGNSVTFLNSSLIAYQSYLKKDMSSLASEFEDASYQSFAIHPQNPMNYNRKNAYEYLGFERFFAIKDFKGYKNTTTFRDKISDQTLYYKMEDLQKAKEPWSGMFLFTVTMQNHGGYAVGEADFKNRIKITYPTGYPDADEFVTLMSYTDDALKQLITYFEAQEQNTMIVMFGDHIPQMDPQFYVDAMGYESMQEDSTLEEASARYKTPFLVWTNYESQELENQKISANFLNVLIAQQANMKLTDYQKFLALLHEKYQVIHALGAIDKDGTYIKNTELETSEDYDWIQKYQIIQYYEMFDQ